MGYGLEIGIGVVQVIVVGSAAYVIRSYVSLALKKMDESAANLKKEIKSEIEKLEKNIKEQCAKQQGHCGRCFNAVKKEQDNIWHTFNAHGHKGLDEDGSKVTRS